MYTAAKSYQFSILNTNPPISTYFNSYCPGQSHCHLNSSLLSGLPKLKLPQSIFYSCQSLLFKTNLAMLKSSRVFLWLVG